MNKLTLTFRAALVASLASASVAFAANSATQTVTFEVQAINELSNSGNPGALVVSTATAGSEPDVATDSSTTYAITTNGTSKKITASIDADMPAGVTLKVTLGAPAGANATQVTLGTVAVDAVTAITEVAESGKTISYELSALVTAGVVASDSTTVTYTVVDSI